LARRRRLRRELKPFRDGVDGATLTPVPDFTQQDLSGSRFEGVSLRDASFQDATLENARFHWVDLTGASITGAKLVDVDIDGDIENLRVNGVEIAPLIEAELDRRHPGRAQMRATTAQEFRDGWELLQSLWRGTIERARGLPEPAVHERVDGEWSFVETMRHLLFVTDAWVVRAVLGHPQPWSPLDLPHDEMADEVTVPRDRDVRPSLDEVLDVLADRRATVTLLMEGLTDEQLDAMTTPVVEPGYPEPESYEVRRCLRTVLMEEWEHRLFAERDLEILEHRTA
jgi:hypothetical protein